MKILQDPKISDVATWVIWKLEDDSASLCDKFNSSPSKLESSPTFRPLCSSTTSNMFMAELKGR